MSSPCRVLQVCIALLFTTTPSVLLLQLSDSQHENVAALPRLGAGDEALLSRLRRQLNAMTYDLGVADVQADRGIDFTTWHSYQFGYGAASRDALTVSELRRAGEFAGAKYNVTAWITGPETRGVALGLAPEALVICKFRPNVTDAICFQTEISGTPTSATIFSTRNMTSLQLDTYVVCAVSRETRHSLQWFVVKPDAILKLANSWPLLHAPSHLLVFQDKLLALHAATDFSSSAEIYDFHLNSSVDLWLSHKLHLRQASSAAFSRVGSKLYLAIAQDEKEVLIYEFDEQKFNLINTIPSKGVKEICGFEISSNSFLAISGSSPRVVAMPALDWQTASRVLIFANDSAVLRWLAVPLATYRDEVLLLAETETRVEIVRWTAPAHFEVETKELPRCVSGEHSLEPSLGCLTVHGLKGVAGLRVGKSSLLLVPSILATQGSRAAEDAQVPTLFVTMVHLENLPSPVEIEVQKLIKERNAIKNLQIAQEVIIAKARQRLENAVPLHNAVILAPWTVEHVSANTVKVSEELSAMDMQLGGHDWSDVDWTVLSPALDQAESAVVSTQAKLAELHTSLNNTAKPDQGGVTRVLSHYQLHGNIAVKGKVIIESAEFESLNDHLVQDLLESTVRLGRPQLIRGKKTFSSLQVEELYVTHTMNGRKLHSFASKDKPIRVYGDMHFKQPLIVAGDLIASEPDEQSNSAARAEKSLYPYLEVKSVQVASHVNNLPATKVVSGLTASPAMRQVSVAGTLTVARNVHITTINGVDIKKLFTSTVPLSVREPLHIPGKTVIKSCSFDDNVDVSFLNNLPFPDGYVQHGRDADILGKKRFTAPIVVDKLKVDGSIDSVPVTELVTLNTAQQIFGQWTMNDLKVLGNLQAQRLITPPHLPVPESELAPVGLKFKQLYVSGKITASHGNWVRSLADIVYKDTSSNQVIVGSKHFTSQVLTKRLQLHGLLNNVNVSEYVTSNTYQQIAGNKILTGDIQFGNLVVGGHCLGTDVAELARDAVRLSATQSTLATLAFTQPLMVDGELRVNNLNDIHDGSDFVTLDTDQTIIGPLLFERLKVRQLTVLGDFNTTSEVSGLDIMSMDSSRVSVTRDQVITGEWSMAEARVSSTFAVDSVNGMDIRNLKGSAILSRIPDAESLVIQELRVVGNLKTETINDYNLSAVANDAIWLNSDNVVTGKLTVLGELTSSTLKVTDKLNNHSIDNFATDIVLKNEQQVTLEGHKTFSKGAHFRNVEANFVNGRKMNEVLSKSTKQEISVPLRFIGSVEILAVDDVDVLNDLRIDEWQKYYSYEDNHHIIIGNVTFTDHFVTKNLEVAKSVAGRDIEHFFPFLIWLNDDFRIHSKKIFLNNVVLEKNLFVAKTINGLDLSQFMKHVVLIDRATSVTGEVIFSQDVFVESDLFVYNDLKVQSVHGCSIKEWIDNAVYVDDQHPIIGAKHFEKIVSHGPINTKYLNDVDMERMLLLNREQFIPEVLTFAEVSTSSDVSVGGLVNELRLDAERENTLMIDGDQEITSPKVFTEDVIVRRDLVTYGPVNGYEIKDVVTLDTNQLIYGPKVFDSIEVKANTYVTGPVSGQDLSLWLNRAVFRDKEDVVTGHWRVHGNVTFLGNVLGKSSGLLGGVHLPSLLTEQAYQREQAREEEMSILNDKYNYCQKIEDLFRVANKQAYVFEYLEGIQYVPTTHPIISYIHFKLGSDNLLALSLENTCAGELLLWDPESTQFSNILTTVLGGVTSWAVLQSASQRGDVVLMTAGESPDCQYDGGNLWLVRNSKPIQILHLQAMGNWTRIEQSPQNANLFYLFDAKGNFSEWQYDTKKGVMFNKDAGEISTDYSNHVLHAESLVTRQRSVSNDTQEPWSRVIFMQTRVNGPNYTITTSRQQARVQGKHDDIMIYEGHPEDKKLFHRLPATNPGLVKSIQFEPSKQTFLVFIEEKAQLQLYKYEGVSGFTHAGSARFLGSHLLGTENLPTRNLFQPRTFLLLATPKPTSGLFLIEMCMLGNPISFLPMPDACPRQNIN